MRYILMAWMISLLLIIYSTVNDIPGKIVRIEEPPALLCVNTYYIPDDFTSAFEIKWRRSSYNEMLYGVFAE
jgi:hypothetical protein